MIVFDVFFLKNCVEFRIGQGWVQWSTRNAGYAHGEWIEIRARGGVIFLRLWRTQTGLDLGSEEIFELHSLLDGTHFYFFEKRIWQIEGRSHKRKLMQKCESANKFLCDYLPRSGGSGSGGVERPEPVDFMVVMNPKSGPHPPRDGCGPVS